VWLRLRVWGDSYLKNNSLTSTPSHTCPWPLCGSLPPQPVSLPAPTPTTSFRGAQAIFRTKPFHILYPTLSTTVTVHTYSPMKMEQTECSETLAFKLQTPGNNPEESIRRRVRAYLILWGGFCIWICAAKSQKQKLKEKLHIWLRPKFCCMLQNRRKNKDQLTANMYLCTEYNVT
jgi:hypothetical protein